MEKIGYIKLHRKSFDNFLYNENRAATKREAWEDILCMVNFADSEVLIGGQIYTCKRGQSLMSLESWGRIFKWDKSKVRRFFNLLLSASMIELENIHKTTRLTVCNYDIYQGERNADETQMTRMRNASETQMTPREEEEEEIKKNKEEIKKNKEEIFNFKKSLLQIGVTNEIASDWLKVRSLKKASNTQTAFNSIQKQIQLSGLSANDCIRIAVERSWQGFKAEWIKEYKPHEEEKMCVFKSKYSGQGMEIKGTYARYKQEIDNFGEENVTFIRYAD